MKCPPHIFRFSEKNFRRYEPVFERVIKLHSPQIKDETISFALEQGSFNTHASRIRDAYHSLIENKWRTDLDVSKLIQIWPKLKITPDADERVTKIAPKANQTFGQQVLTTGQVTNDITVNDPTELELRALMVLQNFQTLPGVTFEITQLAPSIQKSLPSLQHTFPNTVIDFIDQDPSHFLLY